MSVTYKQYTLTDKIFYKVDYICEKCESLNSLIITIPVQSSYTDNNTSLNKYEREFQIDKRKRDAIDKLSLLKDTKIHSIQDGIQKNDFTELKVTCRCKKCNKIPYWAYNPKATELNISSSFFIYQLI